MCLLLRFAEGSEEHACGWVPRDLNDLTFHEKSKEMIIKNRLSSLSCLCPQKTSSSSIFFLMCSQGGCFSTAAAPLGRESVYAFVLGELQAWGVTGWHRQR